MFGSPDARKPEAAGRKLSEAGREDASRPGPNQAPAIALPKGGGALKAIDEKFSVNAVNGTAAISVPLPFSKGRSGFGPAMTLSYNSGNGNGPFGLGWSLDLPGIQRRTDKRLPQYEDAADFDVFVLAGAEDLVPALVRSDSGTWTRDSIRTDKVTVDRYRPRIEGAFARIERIWITGEPAPYWRVTSRANETTIFGRTGSARVADPADPGRVFRWLPEWSYDDKGNCTSFVYKAEDLTGVNRTASERNRLSGDAAIANRYLKRVRHGNCTPYYPDAAAPYDAAAPSDAGYLFEAVFDYGEHDDSAPAPDETGPWPCRGDPFSDCRPGFEVRTYRLCRRVLFFHAFRELDPDGPADAPLRPTLVRSLDLGYRHARFDAAAGPAPRAEADLLIRAERRGYRRAPGGGYASKGLPALELDYAEPGWNTEVRTVDPASLADAPAGITPPVQWVDLYGEGISGLLTEQGAAWHYKRNLGGGRFAPAALVAPKPSPLGLNGGAVRVEDLGADGGRQVVVEDHAAGVRGYFELDPEAERWEPFRALPHVPTIDPADPNVRLLDLDGDGVAELVLSEETAFVWYPGRGREGYEAPRRALKAADEERGPALVFADVTQSVHLADINGDGLVDVVRVRNGEVCYWPSLGYGRFGAKVTMDDAPRFASPDLFDPARVRLTDFTGTGAADLAYLGHDGFRAWLNLAGNAWAPAQSVATFPSTESPNAVAMLDLLGAGTACLVWSSPLPGYAGSALRYIDLTGGQKPYLLRSYRNNLGLEVELSYRSSTSYYLDDRAAGRPWVTRLPFPVHCLSRVVTRERVQDLRFVADYSYHHGYYDHTEREFRGFGLVETLDTEEFEVFSKSGAANAVEEPLHQPPVLTRTWYHTGAARDRGRILGAYRHEYYDDPQAPEHRLPDTEISDAPNPLDAETWRQACRALKGSVLRTEVFARDGTAAEPLPYSTAEQAHDVRVLQPVADGRPGVFLVQEREAITHHYERTVGDPRVGHTLNTAFDDLGNVLEAASVGYGRLPGHNAPDDPAGLAAEQGRLWITYSANAYSSDVVEPDAYRLRAGCEARAYELTGVSPASQRFTIDELQSAFTTAMEIPFEADPAPDGNGRKRLLSHHRSLFARDDDPNEPAPLGVLGRLGLGHSDFALALTPSLVSELYDDRVSADMLTEGGYRNADDLVALGLFLAGSADGSWWVSSGTAIYPEEPAAHFYMADRFRDQFGAITKISYDKAYHLLLEWSEDALSNRTTVLSYDLRHLAAVSVKDINDNVTEAALDMLGLVAGTALRGKGDEADDLNGFEPDLDQATLDAFFADPVAHGADLLKNATSRFVYDVSRQPTCAAAILRETHARDAERAGVPSQLQYAFEYSDGLGRVAMRKAQAEPGVAKRVTIAADGTVTVTEVDTTPALRWIGTGRTVLNNKGNPVLQYEPFFSVMHGYEDAREVVELGVTPVSRYDAAGRLVRTDQPDGSLSRVEFDAWRQVSYDRNDTVLSSAWYAARNGGALGPEEQGAAQKAALHDGTPAVAHLDTLGRAVYAMAHNRFANRVTKAITDEFYTSRSDLDVLGKTRAVFDPRGLAVMRYEYDQLGRQAVSVSMDAGERRSLPDTAGKPLYGWDAKGNRFHTVYDTLRRPVRREVATVTAGSRVIDRTEYGSDLTLNQNGLIVQQLDPSGVVTFGAYDFAGNLLQNTRRFTAQADADIDWANVAGVALDGRSFTTSQSYDALNRVTEAVTSDGSRTRNTYSEANLLTRVDASVRGDAMQAFITHISHDAKGQRLRIDYGNGASTAFGYDPATFRVTRIVTTRAVDGKLLQDLSYLYDPVGNVGSIKDGSQQTVYFNNAVVSPDGDYTYDAVYRLVAATGREQIALNTPPDPWDRLRTHLPHKADGAALQRYLQQYEYDAAGNMTAMVHAAGSGPFANTWTRNFTVALNSNRLASSKVGVTAENFAYDVHGNLNVMPPLPIMAWDVDNHLRGVNLGGGGEAWYGYDSEGHRVRKVVRRQGGLTEERLYLGAFEVFRQTRDMAVLLERESLHILDNVARLALIETRMAGDDPGPAQLIRYQFSNHLSCATLELDDQAAVIGYEEYYPFGSTSFQSADSAREVPIKRYRHCAKERDNETGLYQCGIRYYAAWHGRWLSPDPAGLIDGMNRYTYCRNNPSTREDPHGTQSKSSDDPNDAGNYATLADFQLGITMSLSGDEVLSAWHRAHPRVQIETEIEITTAEYPPNSVVRKTGNFVSEYGETNALNKYSSVPVDPDWQTKGFRAQNPNAEGSAVEHALGELRVKKTDPSTGEKIIVGNSKWMSASENLFISDGQFVGDRAIIDRDKLTAPYMTNEDLLKAARAAQDAGKPIHENWFKNQTEGLTVPGEPELEAPLQGPVPVEAIITEDLLPSTVQVVPMTVPGPKPVAPVGLRVLSGLGVAGGVLFTIKPAYQLGQDIEMMLFPNTNSLGPVGARRTDSVGRGWIRLNKEGWVDEASYRRSVL